MTPVPLTEAVDTHLYGGKAVKLGEALRAGLPAPIGFALDTHLVEAASAGSWRARGAVAEAFDRLGGPVAVRSSAVGEDGAGASFAGQHLTVLNVTSADETIEAVRRVHDSAHEPAALAYRQKRGLGDVEGIGVVIQRLLDPEAAGVMFTRNPLTGADERVIESAWGLGEAVVSGLVTPDTYRVSRSGRLLASEAGDKPVALRRTPGCGTREETLSPERAAALSLGPESVALLNDLAARCEEVYGPDLDIEWAIEGGRACLLQVRPITSMRAREAA